MSHRKKGLALAYGVSSAFLNAVTERNKGNGKTDFQRLSAMEQQQILPDFQSAQKGSHDPTPPTSYQHLDYRQHSGNYHPGTVTISRNEGIYKQNLLR